MSLFHLVFLEEQDAHFPRDRQKVLDEHGKTFSCSSVTALSFLRKYISADRDLAVSLVVLYIKALSLP